MFTHYGLLSNQTIQQLFKFVFETKTKKAAPLWVYPLKRLLSLKEYQDIYNTNRWKLSAYYHYQFPEANCVEHIIKLDCNTTIHQITST